MNNKKEKFNGENLKCVWCINVWFFPLSCVDDDYNITNTKQFVFVFERTKQSSLYLQKKKIYFIDGTLES